MVLQMGSEILNIGRRRARRIYYRPDGTPTSLLPADPYSLIYYQAKGFLLESPKSEPKVEGVKCPLCEFVAKDAFGLQSHIRIHVKSEKEVK